MKVVAIKTVTTPLWVIPVGAEGELEPSGLEVRFPIPGTTIQFRLLLTTLALRASFKAVP